MVMKSIHFKFYCKELGYKISELVESYEDFNVSKDCPEAWPSKVRSLEVDCSQAGGPEVEPTFEAHREAANFELDQDGS